MDKNWINTITDVGCVYGKIKYIITFILIFLILITSLVFYIIAKQKTKQLNFKTTGLIKSTDCNKIIDIDIGNNNNNSNNNTKYICKADILYTSHNNKQHTIKELVNQFQKTNDKINVYYDPTNPRSATTVNYNNIANSIKIICMVLVILLLIIAVIIIFLFKSNLFCKILGTAEGIFDIFRII